MERFRIDRDIVIKYALIPYQITHSLGGDTLDYLKVYDKFKTAFTGNGIAVMENASEVKIKEVINGEYTLSFLLPFKTTTAIYKTIL